MVLSVKEKGELDSLRCVFKGKGRVKGSGERNCKKIKLEFSLKCKYQYFSPYGDGFVVWRFYYVVDMIHPTDFIAFIV